MRSALLCVWFVLVVLGSAACQGSPDAGDTTCQDFAEMGPHTGLSTPVNEPQQSALTQMLKDVNAVSGQEMQAGIQVIAYCNIVDGHAESNTDQPIKNIPGLQ